MALTTLRVAAAIALFLPLPAHAGQSLTNLLPNPGFERIQSGRADSWEAYEQGYAVVSTVRHGGANSIRCENRTAQERRGAVHAVTLNQKQPAPLLIAGWSKAGNVSGSPNGDYAIYVDLEYMDGTPLWGQTAPFSTGTHDWQRRQVFIAAPKPIRSAHIYVLFRNHTGTAWFDDLSAVELSGNNVFDSQPIAPPQLLPVLRRGWFVRDVAANSPILPLVDPSDKPAEGALKLHLRFFNLRVEAMGRIVRYTLQDLTGKPRAVTVYYVERVGGANPVWWSDIRSHEPSGKTGERSNLTRIGAGATGAISFYPFGCVTTDDESLAVGIAPTLGPRIVRIGYHAGSRLLYVAIDVALTAENTANSNGQGRGRAEIAIVRYPVDRRWGFRDAAATYYRLFPDAFTRRATAEGIWIPFTDPSKVENVQDFHIAYHEGDNSLASDDKLGILSFRYTEPMSYWMPMPPETPRTYEAALDMIKRHAAGADEEKRKWAQAVLSSGSKDENGRFNVEFQNAPWTNGAVWTLNPNPRLPHNPQEWTKARLSYTKEMADRIYGSDAKGVQDGEYLDSIEGWADVLDFRPESLRYSQTPPTFTPDTYRPVIPTWFSVYELASFMRDDLHKRGKLLMANSTPWRLFAFAPLLDVMGTETNWLPGGEWRPDSDALFNLRRTLCYHKPYLLLQNTDFDKFGREQMEKYFQRSMFYGVYPSMFSVDAANRPYWQEPHWYNRDRDLFKKYIPVIKRLSASGWEPVTYAESDNPKVYVERFGKKYLTVLNDSKEAAKATLTVDLGRIGWAIPAGFTLRIVDEATGDVVATLPARLTVSVPLDLKPEEGRALRIEMVSGRAERGKTP